jgi:hypothetical protein
LSVRHHTVNFFFVVLVNEDFIARFEPPVVLVEQFLDQNLHAALCTTCHVCIWSRKIALYQLSSERTPLRLLYFLKQRPKFTEQPTKAHSHLARRRGGTSQQWLSDVQHCDQRFDLAIV